MDPAHMLPIYHNRRCAQVLADKRDSAFITKMIMMSILNRLAEEQYITREQQMNIQRKISIN